MKALILSAGLGTRLLPYTQITPKPLFSINEKPVLELIIDRLRLAGCSSVMINTHHHHERIEAYLSANVFSIPVQNRYEPELLGTGGAIRNVSDFWEDGPLMVVNADIVSDIDLAAVYGYHCSHPYPVTMVLHDHAQFNTVRFDDHGFVTGFAAVSTECAPSSCMAFTGIHVLDRTVLDFLPEQGAAHIIDIYARMLAAGRKIKFYAVEGHYWHDIGTPESYRCAVLERMAPHAFEKAFQINAPTRVVQHDLQGDGSDRRWVRLTSGVHSLVMVDHGIRLREDTPQEVDAFVAIGRHLCDKGVAVPRIYLYDRFAGLVFLEDLGDQHLQQVVHGLNPDQTEALYRQVIDRWVSMAIGGLDDFDPRWPYQSRCYDHGVILEKECRYFIDAWVRGWLRQNVDYSEFSSEFERLAKAALKTATIGFMHRDMQSRNIMLKRGTPYFIDFQGGRIGPLQYDLASLLIDPYVALPESMQERLCRHAARTVAQRLGLTEDKFLYSYEYLALCRNLQILGAFGFLSRVKGKTRFEEYIPQALRTLQGRLVRLTVSQHGAIFPKLTRLVQAAARQINA